MPSLPPPCFHATFTYNVHVACWQADLKGINEAKNYWQAYFDKYTYEHEVLAGAADKEANVAFCFWLDKVNPLADLQHELMQPQILSPPNIPNIC